MIRKSKITKIHKSTCWWTTRKKVSRVKSIQKEGITMKSKNFLKMTSMEALLGQASEVDFKDKRLSVECDKKCGNGQMGSNSQGLAVKINLSTKFRLRMRQFTRSLSRILKESLSLLRLTFCLLFSRFLLKSVF